jgi:hypothetical protein
MSIGKGMKMVKKPNPQEEDVDQADERQPGDDSDEEIHGKETEESGEEAETKPKQWARTGWDDAEDYWPDDGGRDFAFMRYFKVDPRTTKRVMFLDGTVFGFFEHDLFDFTKRGNRVPCLKRNDLDKRGCPPCDAGAYAPYVGYFSVIDMGTLVKDRKTGDFMLCGVESRKDANVIYQFERKLFGAKRGSKEKPGALIELKRLAEEHCGGDLTGTVWDCYRPGEKATVVGERFTFVERVKARDMKPYLVELGAEEDKLEMKPFDYMEEFKIPTYDELATIVGTKTARSRQGGQGGRLDDDKDSQDNQDRPAGKRVVRPGRGRVGGDGY